MYSTFITWRFNFERTYCDQKVYNANQLVITNAYINFPKIINLEFLQEYATG